MGYKTRSNYAQCRNLTEERFNNIFKKESIQSEDDKDNQELTNNNITQIVKE